MIDIDVQISPEHSTAVRRLGNLADEFKDKAVRAGLDAASKPILDKMKSEVPVKTGLTRKSVGRSKLSKNQADRLGVPGGANMRPGDAAVLIGPNKRVEGKRRLRIFNLLDQGTDPHTIAPRRQRLLKFVRATLHIRGRGFAKKVDHPGINARNILADSLDAGRIGFGDRFNAGVEKHLAKKGL